MLQALCEVKTVRDKIFFRSLIFPLQAINASLTSKAFLIDGFPRNQDNLKGWEREMTSKAKVLFVLYLHCPEEVYFYCSFLENVILKTNPLRSVCGGG